MKAKDKKIIEVDGSFNAGKFTSIGRVKERVSALGYSTHSIQVDRSEPAKFIDRKNYFGREMSVLTGTVREVIHVIDSSRADFVFIHRGFWDAIAIFGAFLEAGLISEEQSKIGISLAELFTKSIDLVMLIQVPIRVIQERSCPTEAVSDLIRDENFLKVLFNAYEALKTKLPEGSLVINGSHRFGTKGFEKNLDLMSKAVLSLDDCLGGYETTGQFISVNTS